MMGIRMIIRSILLSLALSEWTLATRTLKMVHLLYRHGDRAAISTFPTDPNQESAWPDGFWAADSGVHFLTAVIANYQNVNFTTLVGMRMEYNLGQFLRNRYVVNSSFIKPQYMHKMVYIRSSNSDRCLMSAESQLAGLYPPRGHQVWNKAFPWQPTPVHTVPGDADPMLRPWDCKCPRLSQLRQSKKNSSVYRSVMDKYEGFLQFLTRKSGMAVTFGNFWKISDALFCETQHKMKLASWATKGVIVNLTVMNNFDMSFTRTGDDEFSRLSGGVLLADIVNHLRLFVTKKGQDLPVLNIYSAHDTTVIPLLGALSIYNSITPPYATAVIIELYQEESGKYTVDFLYRNDSSRAPYKLQLPNCSEACPVEEFFRLTKNRVSVNRAEECGTVVHLSNSILQTAHDYIHDNVGLIIGLSIVVILMLVILVGLIIQCRKNSDSQGYSRHQVRRYNLQDTDEDDSDSQILLKG